MFYFLCMLVILLSANYDYLNNIPTQSPEQLEILTEQIRNSDDDEFAHKIRIDNNNEKSKTPKYKTLYQYNSPQLIIKQEYKLENQKKDTIDIKNLTVDKILDENYSIIREDILLEQENADLVNRINFLEKKEDFIDYYLVYGYDKKLDLLKEYYQENDIFFKIRSEKRKTQNILLYKMQKDLYKFDIDFDNWKNIMSALPQGNINTHNSYSYKVDSLVKIYNYSNFCSCNKFFIKSLIADISNTIKQDKKNIQKYLQQKNGLSLFSVIAYELTNDIKMDLDTNEGSSAVHKTLDSVISQGQIIHSLFFYTFYNLTEKEGKELLKIMKKEHDSIIKVVYKDFFTNIRNPKEFLKIVCSNLKLVIIEPGFFSEKKRFFDINYLMSFFLRIQHNIPFKGIKDNTRAKIKNLLKEFLSQDNNILSGVVFNKFSNDIDKFDNFVLDQFKETFNDENNIINNKNPVVEKILSIFKNKDQGMNVMPYVLSAIAIPGVTMLMVNKYKEKANELDKKNAESELELEKQLTELEPAKEEKNSDLTISE